MRMIKFWDQTRKRTVSLLPLPKALPILTLTLRPFKWVNQRKKFASQSVQRIFVQCGKQTSTSTTSHRENHLSWLLDQHRLLSSFDIRRQRCLVFYISKTLHPDSSLTHFEQTDGKHIDVQPELEDSNQLGVKRAAIRKLNHELGIPTNLLSTDDFQFLTRIVYKAPSDEIWGEHEG